MLAMLGGVVFDVQPTNLDAINRENGQDWAPKAIVGAEKPREAMGVADAKTTLAGKLIPQLFGMGGLADLVAMAESYAPQMLIGGDGTIYGWHCVERVTQKHTYLDRNGVGKIIEFDVTLVRSPNGAGASAMMTLLQGLF